MFPPFEDEAFALDRLVLCLLAGGALSTSSTTGSTSPTASPSPSPEGSGGSSPPWSVGSAGRVAVSLGGSAGNKYDMVRNQRWVRWDPRVKLIAAVTFTGLLGAIPTVQTVFKAVDAAASWL